MVQKYLKLMITISLFFLIIYLIKYPFPVFSQHEVTNAISNNTWISKRDNLNITMKTMPEIPIIDEKTKLSFEIRNLNDSKFVEGFNSRVTITDDAGRLFKFNNQYIETRHDPGQRFLEILDLLRNKINKRNEVISSEKPERF